MLRTLRTFARLPGASFSDLSSNLTTDFSTVLTDVTSLLGGGLDLGTILGGLGL